VLASVALASAAVLASAASSAAFSASSSAVCGFQLGPGVQDGLVGLGLGLGCGRCGLLGLDDRGLGRVGVRRHVLGEERDGVVHRDDGCVVLLLRAFDGLLELFDRRLRLLRLLRGGLLVGEGRGGGQEGDRGDHGGGDGGGENTANLHMDP
jgi:hypothetical protein